MMEQEKEQRRVTVDGEASYRAGAKEGTDGAGVSRVTVDTWSRFIVSFSFPYPTGATKETDVDIP
jgi:hypothetical protein